jgi:hypothetical protein
VAISVRYVYDDHLLLGTGEKIWVSDFGTFGAPIAVARDVSLPRLRQALEMHARVWEESEGGLWLSDDPPERFNDETSPRFPYELTWRDGELLLAVDVWSEEPLPADEQLAMGVGPLLTRWRGELIALEEAHVDYGQRGHSSFAGRWQDKPLTTQLSLAKSYSTSRTSLRVAALIE